MTSDSVRSRRPRRKGVRGVLPAALAVLVLSGCAPILAPQPDLSRFYVLSSLEEPAAGRPLADLSIALVPVQIPNYLQRPQIVTRVSSSRVELAETERWAEPLEVSLARTLARNLSHLLGTDLIFSPPSFQSAAPAYRLEVSLLRFEGNRGGDAELSSRWLIKSGRSGELLFVRSSVFTEAGGEGTDGMVRALSQTLADLSREIATEIRRLEEERSN